MNIMNVVAVAFVAYFWVNSIGCSGEFHVVFKHFQNFRNLILNILKKKWLHLALWPLFSLKPCKTFRIVQCKQPQLVKPWLNFDLHFRFQSSHTALLEVSFILTPSQSPPWKPFSPTFLDTLTTALMCIFSSILKCS